MNEGYQDREDPGLTVRFPLLDRPGEALLVWTTTPWTLTANVAAAVGPDLRYVKVRQGDDVFWLGKGTLKTALQGPFTRRGRGRRGGARRLALYGAVRRRSRPWSRRSTRQGYEHRVVAWDEVGEDEGTGIVHIAPGLRRRGLPAGQGAGAAGHRPDRRGRSLPRGLRLAHRPRGAGGRRADRRRPRAARVLLPPRGVQPPLPALLAVQHAAAVPARRRVVHLDGRGLRPAAGDAHEGAGRREPALPDHGRRRRHPVDPGVRLRPRARLAPQHARLDDLARSATGASRCRSTTVPSAGPFEVVGGREELGAQAVEGWEDFEGHTPHRPWIDAVQDRVPGLRRRGRAHHGRRQPVARRRASCRSRTLHFREDPRVLGEVVPGRLHHRELPGPVPQLVLLDARDVHGAQARRRRSRRSSATPSSSARTGARCTRAGATRSSSTRRPTGWASTSCAGCSRRPGPRTTSCSAGTPRTRPAGSSSSCGTCTPSS